MIFYFTGTGNSLFIARLIANGIENKSIKDISELMYNKTDLSIYKDEEYIGIVFPVYGFNPPNIVLDFCKKLPVFNKSTYVFGVANFAEEAGAAHTTFNKVLKNKKIKLNAWFNVIMPNNYMLFGPLEGDEANNKILDEAKGAVAGITNEIKLKINITQYKGTFFDEAKTGIVKAFYEPMISSIRKKFYATNVCNGCGYCKKMCPTKSINMENNKPTWKIGCVACFACINRCPKGAIENGKKSIGNGRYVNPIIK